MDQYFPKPFVHYSGNVKAELELSNYATKANLKGTTNVDTSDLLAKSDLTSLKPEADEIDIDKLKAVPADLSKLSNVVENDVVKETVYDKLVTKINAIDTSGFVLKVQYYPNK